MGQKRTTQPEEEKKVEKTFTKKKRQKKNFSPDIRYVNKADINQINE